MKKRLLLAIVLILVLAGGLFAFTYFKGRDHISYEKYHDARDIS
jgi:hypothetical protein